MYTVFIRAAGGREKGLGHLVRCISLAKELVKHNFNIVFMVNYDESVITILNENNLNYYILKSESLEDEVYEIDNIIGHEKNSIILTDSYWMSNKYLKQLKKISRYLISIDDINLYDYPSDIVINSNIYASDLKYKKNKGSKYLLGSNYLIFRDEFINSNKIDIKENCENILITMGGTDINDYTIEAIKCIQSIKDIRINVVIGPGFKNIDEIIKESNKYENIKLIFNPKNIIEVMKENDIAISAAGTTSYELALLGIPSILVIQVDNQVMVADKMDEFGMSISAGWFNEVDENKLNKMCKKLIIDYKQRKEMSTVCKKSIASDGIKNIVNEIKQMIK